MFSDRGKRRKINEDSVACFTDHSLWVVADGMGGHHAGDYASKMIIEELRAYRKKRFSGENLRQLEAILDRCNRQLVDKATFDGVSVCGSTVAALSFNGTSATCSWCGDSRIYRIRHGEIAQLTRDHTVGCVSDDRDKHRHSEPLPGNREFLVSAIGGAETTMVEHCWYSVDPCDQYIICTDGLNKEISDSRLLELVTSSNSLDVVNRIKDDYFESSARDNIGVIYIYAAE